jgi:hypothetical protein
VKKGRSGGVRTGFQSKFILSIWMSVLVLQHLDEGGDVGRFDGSEFPDAMRLAPLYEAALRCSMRAAGCSGPAADAVR